MSNQIKDKVAVAILNWNGVVLLKQFVPSIIEHSIDHASIYVIDNNSSDDSLAYLATNYPQINIIKNDENYGYAGGYNVGIERIKEEYIILLNSDIEVTKNWIPPVIELMVKDKNIAACQPKIKDFNNRDSFEYAGAAGGFIDKYGYPFCRGRVFDTLEKDNAQYDDSIEVFWATGACLFVRKDAFIRAGKLDTNFFAHMEEIDLCWRMINLGNKIMYCGDSEVYHVGGGTLNKANPKKTFLNFRNSLLMLYKNLPKQLIFKTIFIRLVLDGVASIQFLLKGSIKETIAIIKAHFSFYSHIRKYKTSTASKLPNNIVMTGIVYQYFAKGKKFYSDLDQ